MAARGTWSPSTCASRQQPLLPPSRCHRGAPCQGPARDQNVAWAPRELAVLRRARGVRAQGPEGTTAGRSQHSRNPTPPLQRGDGAWGLGPRRRLSGRAGGRAGSWGLRGDPGGGDSSPEQGPCRRWAPVLPLHTPWGAVAGCQGGAREQGLPGRGPPLRGGPAPAWTPLRHGTARLRLHEMLLMVPEVGVTSIVHKSRNGTP